MKKEDETFVFTTGVVGYPIGFVLLIWIVFWAELRFGLDLADYGILPRTLEGLRGILFSPFIHGSLRHLFQNTVPLFVLSCSLFYFYRGLSWRVLMLGLLLTGLLTWSIGRPAYHIGASGIIYMLAGFLFFKGVFSKYFRLIALSLIVVFLYGGLLWYITPIDPEISWEGHLSGLLVGFAFAVLFKKQVPGPKKFEWEKEDYKEDNDPFMKHFDKDGNFVELPEEEEEPIYYYTFKKDKKD